MMQEKKKAKVEKIAQLNALDREAKLLEQQLILLDQQVAELKAIQLSLAEIQKAGLGQEMLMPLGRNTFIKSKLASKDLLLNVGSGVVLKKTISEASKTIAKDLAELAKAKIAASNHLSAIADQAAQLDKDIRKQE